MTVPTPPAPASTPRARRWTLAHWAPLVLGLLGLVGCDDSTPDKLRYPDGGVIVRLPGVEQGGREPIMALTPELKPVTRPAFRTVKRDFFECQGLVGAWYQKMVVAEMNYLARHDGLTEMADPVCLVSMDLSLGHREGRFKIHLYKDLAELKECEMNLRCTWARNVSLAVRDQRIYRSYFLSDFKRERYYQHCITPENRFFANVTCYVVDAK